jgi:hypothetical protein
VRVHEACGDARARLTGTPPTRSTPWILRLGLLSRRRRGETASTAIWLSRAVYQVERWFAPHVEIEPLRAQFQHASPVSKRADKGPLRLIGKISAISGG